MNEARGAQRTFSNAARVHRPFAAAAEAAATATKLPMEVSIYVFRFSAVRNNAYDGTQQNMQAPPGRRRTKKACVPTTQQTSFSVRRVIEVGWVRSRLRGGG